MAGAYVCDGNNRHLVVKTGKQRKKRNLKRLNSSCSYYESSDSGEFNELESSKAKLIRMKLDDVESASLTSHSQNVMSAELQPEDDNSSLSDVEILGNAVREKTLFFYRYKQCIGFMLC